MTMWSHTKVTNLEMRGPLHTHTHALEFHSFWQKELATYERPRR